MTTNSLINIIVVDDHSMIIEGMRAILEKIPSVQLTATASNSIEAIAALRQSSIHIAFVDINMPGNSGIELCEKIKKEFPAILVLALSTFKQRSYVSEMIKNGASGYLLKSADKEEIEEAIQTVLSGKMYFSTGISNNAFEPSPDEPPTLTRREKEILQLISEGFTNSDIAVKIFVSAYTVDTHRKNLLAKFEVSNTAMLIKKAVNYGLL
jgi:two-component system, NarL family, nitrate/nitrite response regulator NarL